MKNATEFARHPARATQARSLKALLLAVAASAVIAGCGGGAATTDNPLTQGGGGTTLQYNGPGPRNGDPDIFAFQQEFWQQVRTQGTCANCHNEVDGQVPLFVRGDDVNLAYDEAVMLIDRDQPSLSRLVEKVGGGHNCWNSDPSSCAAIMTTWIENWVGGSIAAGGRHDRADAADVDGSGREQELPDRCRGLRVADPSADPRAVLLGLSQLRVGKRAAAVFRRSRTWPRRL